MATRLIRRYTWLLLAVPLGISACGKKGPLIYPDLLVPAAPPVVEARQFGDDIRLSFVLPSRDMAGRRYDGLTGVRIVRREEPAGKAPGCDACSDDFSLLRKLDLARLPADVERSGSLVLLLDSTVRPGSRYAYRITPIGADNVDGATSPAAAAVIFAAPPAPVLQVVSHPTELVLEFVSLPPETGDIVGYQVYRAVKGKRFPLQPISAGPVVGNRFSDQGLERNTTYVYAVRSVVRMAGGDVAESRSSNQAEGMLKNDE